jgi:hypothetical protein
MLGEALLLRPVLPRGGRTQRTHYVGTLASTDTVGGRRMAVPSTTMRTARRVVTTTTGACMTHDRRISTVQVLLGSVIGSSKRLNVESPAFQPKELAPTNGQLDPRSTTISPKSATATPFTPKTNAASAFSLPPSGSSVRSATSHDPKVVKKRNTSGSDVFGVIMKPRV